MRAGTVIATGIAALALSAGAAGVASAAAPDSAVGRAATAIGDTITRVSDHRGGAKVDLFRAAAEFIGITPEQLRTEMGTDKSIADVAVAHGKTRAGLVDALAQAARTRIESFVDHKGAPAARPGMKAAIAIGDRFETVAAYLGTTLEDLRTKLTAGQTLAQIANATPGKSRDGLVQAITAAEHAAIDAAQANGRITAEQAQRLRERLADTVSRFVDQTPMKGPRGRR